MSAARPSFLPLFSEKLNLGVDNAIVESALPYLDLRHILVHRDGRIDRDFAARHPQLGLNEGDDFSLSHSDIVRARDAILTLVSHFDERIIHTGSILPEDQQPNCRTNKLINNNAIDPNA